MNAIYSYWDLNIDYRVVKEWYKKDFKWLLPPEEVGSSNNSSKSSLTETEYRDKIKKRHKASFFYFSSISTKICFTLPFPLETGTLVPIEMIKTLPFNLLRSKLSQ